MLNNFELDEKSKELEDTMTPYALARRVAELEDKERDCIREFVEKNVPFLYCREISEEFVDEGDKTVQFERERIRGLVGL